MDGIDSKMGNESWVLASHNEGKIKELREILSRFDVQLMGAADISLAEPEETEKTYAGNALLKARAACETTGRVSLGDDSGLSVDALGGEPGVFSARWAGEPRDFDRAMKRVHEALLESGSEDRTARFVCVLALACPDGRTETYHGEVVGQIVWPPRGEGGFGYDAIFQPDGETRSFAQMSRAEKRALSHRGRALDKLVEAEFSK